MIIGTVQANNLRELLEKLQDLTVRTERNVDEIYVMGKDVPLTVSLRENILSDKSKTYDLLFS